MPQIKVNTYGQRILTIDDVIPRNYQEQIKYDDYDAVFIDISLPANMEVILKRINPVTINESVYKPFFAPRSLKGRIGLCESMIDEFISSPDEHLVNATIDNIQHWIKEYNVPRQYDNVNNHYMLIVRMFRYFISRNHLVLTPEVIEKSAMGCAFPLVEFVHSWGLFHLREYYAWLELSDTKGTIRFRKTVYRTHLCPKCQHSHLIYLETCPECGSNLLQYEQVIHHFPCANISPEHTYNVGGQLICPKCHKQLRHVGIDYDRPAALYFCSNCGKSFLHPDTKALCTYCGTEVNVSELYPHDVHEIEITAQGIINLTEGKYSFSPYSDYYNNYLSIESFENRLQLIVNRTLEGDVIKSLLMIQLWTKNEKGEILDLPNRFINAASRLLPTNKMTSTFNSLFIQYTILDGDTDETLNNFLTYARKQIHLLAIFLAPGMTMYYSFLRVGDNVEQDREFLHSWRILTPDPDGEIHYDDVEHPEGVTPLEFIISKTRQHEKEGDNELERRYKRNEKIKEELDDMQERPLITKIVGYVSWGFFLLGVIALLAVVLGYYLFIK